MSEPLSESPNECDFERESSRLNDGLKSCRAMVDTYRAMISGENEPANDAGGFGAYMSTTANPSNGYDGNSATG